MLARGVIEVPLAASQKFKSMESRGVNLSQWQNCNDVLRKHHGGERHSLCLSLSIYNN